jgi:hypothetical protein
MSWTGGGPRERARRRQEDEWHDDWLRNAPPTFLVTADEVIEARQP